MSSTRVRFSAARQVFEMFPTAARYVRTPSGEEEPLAFARKLLHSERPAEAIAYCAFLLPRREAVWWDCRCCAALIEGVDADRAFRAAEAWVREPEDATRRAALVLAEKSDRPLATMWLARAAGWSGGNIGPAESDRVLAPPHLTALAVYSSIMFAVAQGGAGNRAEWVRACAVAGIRCAETGDARVQPPPARAPSPAPEKRSYGAVSFDTM